MKTHAFSLILSLSASAASAQNTDVSITDPTPAMVEADFSGPIETTEQAMNFALSGGHIPNANVVKVERLKAQYSERGHRWEILFRDGDKTYEAIVGQNRSFELAKKFDEDEDNDAFWLTLPDPLSIEWPEHYLAEATRIVEAFNPTYTASSQAIVEYEVCDPPKLGTESNYNNGCRSDENKHNWEVIVQITGVVRGEQDTFYKIVSFRDGLPTSLGNASVWGSW